MSTQLILYPQTYEGEYSSFANPSTIQYIVNGISFTGFNNTTLHNTTSTHPSEDAILNEHPSILGNWYRFTTTGGDYGAVTAPVYALGAVQFSHNAVTAGQTGIYQKLSQLVVGAIYDVKISIVTPQAELLTFEMWDGTVNVHQAPLSANTYIITTTFTAQSSNDIFLLYYEGIAANLSISKISILQSPTSPSLVYSELHDGQVICDLYQEEDIPLTLSIDDFKNAAEQVKSYSKDFNLPATKRNNQIFNNMFEITRADDGLIFNPYVKTKCVLKQDGFILLEGYLRLIDVKDKEGEISYNVNLYSDVIALADILKDKPFSELDFTELEHDYDKDSIKQSWNDGAWQDIGLPLLNYSVSNPLPTSSFAYDASLTNPEDHTSVLKYPFIDWTHQFLVGGSGTGNNAIDGYPELTTLETAFRPCIQLKYLINKIFAASGFNWTSDFFDSADFGELYMDFNWGADNAPVVFNSSGGLTNLSVFSIPATYTTLDFDEMTTINGNTLSDNFGYSSGAFTAQEDGQVYTFNYNMKFTQPLSVDTLSVQWLVNGVAVDAATSTAPFFYYSGNFTTPPLAAGDTVLCQAKSPLGLYDLEGVLGTLSSTQPLITVTTSVNQITNDTFLETLRGELGQWDFLKGIFTMFNLVSLVDENNPDNILIEPYGDIFINNTNCSTTTSGLTLACRSIQHDWTNKVDVSQMELKPLTDLNKNTIFQFVEDDDDYAFQVYKNSKSGHLYGSKEIDASGFTILEGTKEIIAEPFAATLSKSLMAQFPSFIVPSIYSMTDDGTSEGFENSPRIFYNNGVKDTGISYYIPAQNTLSSENQTNFLQFSHLSDIPTVVTTPPSATDTRDFVFESQQLFSGLGNSPTDNLFSTYWQPYFNELYNADTRTMTLKVNLSPSDVASFKFYDTVFVKNRAFRVNRIDYKPNDLATVEFILIP
jgi:hypothetical protein